MRTFLGKNCFWAINWWQRDFRGIIFSLNLAKTLFAFFSLDSFLVHWKPYLYNITRHSYKYVAYSRPIGWTDIQKKIKFFKIFHGQRQALQLVLYKSYPLWVDKKTKQIFVKWYSRFQIYKKCLWHEDWMPEHTSYFISVQISLSVLHFYICYILKEKKYSSSNKIFHIWQCQIYNW